MATDSTWSSARRIVMTTDLEHISADHIVAPASASPIIVRSTSPCPPVCVVVVGAGGNGARLVPPLTQVLRTHDSIAIIDHDIVEDRNLRRQHFVAADIGQHKAAVLARRYGGRRIPVQAFTSKLERASALTIVHEAFAASPTNRGEHAPRLIIMGCVDNAEARVTIDSLMSSWPSTAAWIDIGNEFRGGQVLMSLKQWRASVSGGTLAAPSQQNWTIPTMRRAMPQLLIPDPAAAAAEGCADRIDLQTVMVNHMASAAALNCLSWLLLGTPFVSAGAFFSTLNTMQPIMLRGIDAHRIEVLPTTEYAAAPQA